MRVAIMRCGGVGGGAGGGEAGDGTLAISIVCAVATDLITQRRLLKTGGFGSAEPDVVVLTGAGSV